MINTREELAELANELLEALKEIGCDCPNCFVTELIKRAEKILK